jgi:hypothetical protein
VEELKKLMTQMLKWETFGFVPTQSHNELQMKFDTIVDTLIAYDLMF